MASKTAYDVDIVRLLFADVETIPMFAFRSEYDPSGGTDEDELFEVNAEATIKTYKLEVVPPTLSFRTSLVS